MVAGKLNLNLHSHNKSFENQKLELKEATTEKNVSFNDAPDRAEWKFTHVCQKIHFNSFRQTNMTDDIDSQYDQTKWNNGPQCKFK